MCIGFLLFMLLYFICGLTTAVIMVKVEKGSADTDEKVITFIFWWIFAFVGIGHILCKGFVWLVDLVVDWTDKIDLRAAWEALFHKKDE